MKAQLIGKNRGSSTLEILIAFAVLILSITAVIVIGFGNQNVSIDTETNSEALLMAQKELEIARADSRKDFMSLVGKLGTETLGPLTYNKKLEIEDLTQCKKQATSTISWTVGSRVQKIELSTFLSDVTGTLALGGDCAINPPGPKWDNPQRFAEDTLNPGKPTSIDVLNKIVYLGGDMPPYLYIADSRNAFLGQIGGLFVTFTNGFSAKDKINAIDVAKWRDPLIGITKNYVFAAMASTTSQFAVINVTDIQKPDLVARFSLRNVNPASNTEGWRVLYYGGYAYVGTRYMNGKPEFHIFDVSNPESPEERGGGVVISTSIYGIAAHDRMISGALHRFVYLVTTYDTNEVVVLDVTDPTNVIKVTGAYTDLPGNKDSRSVFLIGNKLYVGLESGAGSELFILDVSNPLGATSGLPILGDKDTGTSVGDLFVAERFAFLATSKNSEEFQVWNIANPANIFPIKKYNFGNIVEQGLDFESDFVYATGQATPNFQILYSPPI